MRRLRLVMCIPLAALLLSGCSTSKEELLPAGDQTMLELWQGKTTGGSQHVIGILHDKDVRPVLTG